MPEYKTNSTTNKIKPSTEKKIEKIEKVEKVQKVEKTVIKQRPKTVVF